ncbi:MAG: histidine kinase, partial [Kamptonema sp. SIO4C4]|nr:histidine kinase [Kamptonema sp. SIO4C4]
MTGKGFKSTIYKLPIRTTLMISFVLQVVIAVGLIWLITYRSGQKAVKDVALQLRAELTNRIMDKLDAYTDIPLHVNRMNANALAQNALEVSPPQGEFQFWQQMQSYPTLSYIYCGDEQGGFMGVGRLSQEDRSQLGLFFSNAATNFIRQDFGLDERGNRTVQTGTLEKHYDPRGRPWYKAAKASQEAVWSDIYLSFSTQLPTLTASVPVYSPSDGSLLGVCGTDFFLSEEMSHFLQNLEIGKTGTAFIMERSGTLVATSSQEPMLEGSGENLERLVATASDDVDIQETTQYLKSQFSDLDGIQAVQKLDFTLDGERQYLQVVPFQKQNLDWLVVLVIPESDF